MTTLSLFAPDLSGVTGMYAFVRRSDTGELLNTGGDALSESPASSGRFECVVAETLPAVVCSVAVYSGSSETAAAALLQGWLPSGGTLITDTYQSGGAGDADQDTLLAVQETVDELAAALVGAESIALTGPVTGSDISIVIDSDYRQRSGTELPIPVDDSTGALSTRLNALGLDNLSFGAAREGKAAGEITGTVYSVTNAAGVTTIRVEISNAGSGLSPGEYAWQLQASTTQGDEVDNEIVISGNLILERRTVSPL